MTATNGHSDEDPPLSYMAALGARLIDAGFPILPIEPGTKRPGILANGVWRPMPGWTRHCVRPTTLIEHAIWSRWPECSIGIACGVVVGADIDIVEDVQIAGKVDELARQMLGDTPLVRVGLWPKRLLLYRAVEPFAGIREFYPIEIMARGQQVVAYGRHPETGLPYRWLDDSPAETHLTALPEVSEAQCREFIQAAYALVPDRLKRALSVDPTGARHMTSGRLAGTSQAIESALDALPNPELDWNAWNTIGMALCAAIGSEGADAWARWSAKASKNDPKTTAHTWRNYRRERIHSVGAGTIYYQAELHGWRCPADITMDGAAPTWKPGEHPAQAIIDCTIGALPVGGDGPRGDEPSEVNIFVEGVLGQEKIGGGGALPPPHHSTCAAAVANDDRDSNIFVPDAFRQEQLTGFIAGFVEHTLASAIRPQPILAVAGALALTAAIAGRHYRSPTNLRTNIYTVSIVESGGGKNHAPGVVSEIISQAELGRVSGGHKLVSGGGLLSALYRSPSCIFQLDEFGDFLSSVLDKRHTSHKTEIWALLKDLATHASGTYNGAEYTDQENRPRKDIVQPNCVIHATTEPNAFWGALKSRSVIDGGLARWLIFVTDDPIPTRNKKPRDITAIPETVIEQAKAISKGAEDWKSNLGDGPSVDPCPHVAHYSQPAEELLDDIWNTIDARQRHELGNGHGAILSRWHEHIVRVALCYAISEAPQDPIITLAAVEWAKAIVDYCVGIMLRDTDRWIADSEAEHDLNRVLSVIRNAGDSGLSGHDLAGRTRFLGGNRRRRDDIVADLAEAGRILIAETKPNGAGRPRRIYRAIANRS
jgi:Bifunctional DNA primase/polymerase, N-terminal/Primase C terminal 2 (PriCT-2)/Protein of unknown function (DUF3987)